MIMVASCINDVDKQLIDIFYIELINFINYLSVLNIIKYLLHTKNNKISGKLIKFDLL